MGLFFLGSPLSGIWRPPPWRRDFAFVAVAHGQQHVLGEVQVAALLAVVFEDVVSTMESTGQLSSQKPQKMHLVRSMS
jgi:hypothetical protein